MQEFFHQIPLLKEELTRYAKSKNTVIIQASSESSLHTLQKVYKSILSNYHLIHQISW